MIYILSFDFCTFSWLWWLISGLLGLLAGYLIWARWRKKYDEMEENYNSLSGKHSKLEDALKESQHKVAMLDGDIATANGRVREMQALVESSKNSGGSGNTSALNAEIKGLKAELKTLTTSLEASKKSLDSTKKDLETTKSDLKASDASNKKWEAQVSKLQADLDAGKVSGTGKKAVTSGKADTSNLASGIAGAFVGSALTGEGNDKKSTFDATKLKNTNLQIVEGIGPKMESVLQGAGVNTWSDLANKSENEIREILDAHGDKYKMINPESWSLQAGLASEGKWDELVTLQKQLDAGTDSNIDMTDSKLEKKVQKSNKSGFGKYKVNDLKIVEGIGPKIAELLNKNGITTWKELSETKVEKIQSILAGEGSRFSLANPGSWPQQAGLAAAEKWEELAKLQDELSGGV